MSSCGPRPSGVNWFRINNYNIQTHDHPSGKEVLHQSEFCLLMTGDNTKQGESDMCVSITPKRRHAAQKLVWRFDKFLFPCICLLIMAPVHAMTVDSFNAADDLSHTLPRSISAPGTDFTQIQTTIGTAIADRTITVTMGTVNLTGTTLDMPGNSAATIQYVFDPVVDLTSGGDNAFFLDFSISDSSEAILTLSGTSDDGSNPFSWGYEPRYWVVADGMYTDTYIFDPQILAEFMSIDTITIDITTSGGQNTFSLDTFGTTFVVPLPPAVLLFGSALGLLGWIKQKAG